MVTALAPAGPEQGHLPARHGRRELSGQGGAGSVSSRGPITQRGAIPLASNESFSGWTSAPAGSVGWAPRGAWTCEHGHLSARPVPAPDYNFNRRRPRPPHGALPASRQWPRTRYSLRPAHDRLPARANPRRLPSPCPSKAFAHPGLCAVLLGSTWPVRDCRGDGRCESRGNGSLGLNCHTRH